MSTHQTLKDGYREIEEQRKSEETATEQTEAPADASPLDLLRIGYRKE